MLHSRKSSSLRQKTHFRRLPHFCKNCFKDFISFDFQCPSDLKVPFVFCILVLITLSVIPPTMFYLYQQIVVPRHLAFVYPNFRHSTTDLLLLCTVLVANVFCVFSLNLEGISPLSRLLPLLSECFPK